MNNKKRDTKSAAIFFCLLRFLRIFSLFNSKLRLDLGLGMGFGVTFVRMRTSMRMRLTRRRRNRVEIGGVWVIGQSSQSFFIQSFIFFCYL